MPPRSHPDATPGDVGDRGRQCPDVGLRPYPLPKAAMFPASRWHWSCFHPHIAELPQLAPIDARAPPAPHFGMLLETHPSLSSMIGHAARKHAAAVDEAAPAQWVGGASARTSKSSADVVLRPQPRQISCARCSVDVVVMDIAMPS